MSCKSGLGRENPWNKNFVERESKKNREGNFKNTIEEVEDRFRTAHERLQASVKKHLEQEYELSSSDEENLETEPILNAVLKDYKQLSGSPEGLEKTRQFLENSFQSGAGICLICIENIKRIDPIWNCLECYGFFHLNCIQKWSMDSIFQQKQAQDDMPEFKKSNKISWGCPKCRHEYEKCDIPQKYLCFCCKTQDPLYEPFLVPHSCGEKCDKLLKPDCGHFCLLLCHPGPCPPCPKTVEIYCHCKKSGPKVQRCSNKLWSCDLRCEKPLLCKKHFCEELCHPGDCPPCNKESIQKCQCGLNKRKQPCMTPEWQCEMICGKPFKCGFHNCAVKCHAGVCGDCPKSLERTCPCGKTVSILPCTEEIPTCNETCGKLLECNSHYCSQKCHKNNCGMCLEIVTKVCRCGLHKKELPCEKKYLCESKCKLLKNCGRHPCNRKCCNMHCPPCEKKCNRTLSCGNHKCPAICHRGLCYPCPEVVPIRCRCGDTVISVACGRERKTRPPKCSKLCLITPRCHHSSTEPHKCHFGECPPCTRICGKSMKNCSHKCLVKCHSAVWQEINENPCPAGPWEAFPSRLKRCNLPCPDCQVPVPVTCLGGHETKDRPCYKAQPSPCTKPCGRLLQCGNHLCEKLCHEVIGAADSILAGENCSECKSECLKERPKGCTHQCPNPCHPGDCPPCAFNLRVKCHCSLIFLYIHCNEFCSTDEKYKETLLSCGSLCPKELSCGHQCQLNCHSGDCQILQVCKEKVKVTCNCGRIKKDIICNQWTKGFKTINCNEKCLSKLNDKEKTKELLKLEKKELKEDIFMKKNVNSEMKYTEKILLSNLYAKDTFLGKHKFILVGATFAVAATVCFFLLGQ